jgi:hypothetical protein
MSEEHKIDKILHELSRIGFYLFHPAAKFLIKQKRGHMRTRLGALVPGTVPGTTSGFAQAPLQADGTPGALQAGSIPVWSCDDPNVVLVPSADGSTCTASLPLSDTQGSAPAGSPGSYNLTVSGVNSAGNAISTPFNVPILPIPEGPATQFGISQTS